MSIQGAISFSTPTSNELAENIPHTHQIGVDLAFLKYHPLDNWNVFYGISSSTQFRFMIQGEENGLKWKSATFQGWGLIGGLGYQVNPELSLSFDLQLGYYPSIGNSEMGKLPPLIGITPSLSLNLTW